MNLKVTVVVPVYNAEKYLSKLLESLINQTLKELEIICVDDGSTDNSLTILKNYQQKDSRIKVLQQRNQFAGVARNNGLKIAQGEYVTFIDSDDYCELNGLQNLYKTATKYKLDFVKCASYCYDETRMKYIRSDFYSNAKARNILNIVTRFKEYPKVLYDVADVPWNGLYKTNFLKKENISFPNFRCVNDHSFFVNCLIKAQRLMITDFYFVHHRINRIGSLIDTKHFYFENQIKNFNRVKEILKQVNDDKIEKLFLSKEFTSLFYWYEVLMKRGINNQNINNQMLMFLKNLDANDIEEFYIKYFYYTNLKRISKFDNEIIECIKNLAETDFCSSFGIIRNIYGNLWKLKRIIKEYKDFGFKYLIKI